MTRIFILLFLYSTLSLANSYKEELTSLLSETNNLFPATYKSMEKDKGDSGTVGKWISYLKDEYSPLRLSLNKHDRNSADTLASFFETAFYPETKFKGALLVLLSEAKDNPAYQKALSLLRSNNTSCLPQASAAKPQKTTENHKSVADFKYCQGRTIHCNSLV